MDQELVAARLVRAVESKRQLQEVAPFRAVALQPTLPRSLVGSASAVAMGALSDFRLRPTAGDDRVAAGGAPNRFATPVGSHETPIRCVRSTRSRMLERHPFALPSLLKYAFNLIDDGIVGQQLFAGEATRLAYGTEEVKEGRDSFLEKRDADWSGVPWL